MLFGKVFQSLSIFILSFFALESLPYYPFKAVLIFSALICLISSFAMQSAIIAFSILFFIALSYHSLSLAMLYATFFVGLTAIYAYQRDRFTKIFLCLTLAPILARSGVGMELIIIFIAYIYYTHISYPIFIICIDLFQNIESLLSYLFTS